MNGIMKKSLLLFLLLSTVAAQGADLVVSAAASLTNALTELKPLFEAGHPGNTVLCNFGASGSLAKQIEGGAPADLFVSASSRQMDRLASKGLLLGGSRMDLLSNEIVLITPVDSKLGLKGFPDLVRAKRIAMGDPGFVPAGQYASQTLGKLGLSQALAPKLVYGENVRQVLDYVARGEVDAGIEFATDAAIMPGKVAVVAQAPKGTHKPIIYPAAVMKDALHPALAHEFAAFLSGPEGRRIFAKYGFEIVAH